jgi:hypothetical protein
MSCTQTESQLRTLARDRIKQNRLPITTRVEIWGGYGNGEVCSVCDHPIGPCRNALRNSRC